mgnify:CR=1 FL=1
MTDKFLSPSSASTDIFDDIAATRQKLGLVPGTTIQSHNAKLDSLAGLTLSSGKILKATGTNTFSLLTLTSHGETALSSNNALLTSSDIPTNISSFTNDSNYITFKENILDSCFTCLKDIFFNIKTWCDRVQTCTWF